MYLHIGQNTMVRFDDIIGIFDIDTTSVSAVTKEFLKSAQDSGEIVNVSDDLPKSFLVSSPKDGYTGRQVYISQISSATLLKRSLLKGELFQEEAE